MPAHGKNYTSEQCEPSVKKILRIVKIPIFGAEPKGMGPALGPDAFVQLEGKLLL